MINLHMLKKPIWDNKNYIRKDYEQYLSSKVYKERLITHFEHYINKVEQNV